jgi:ribose 5-phosphate isomerase
MKALILLATLFIFGTMATHAQSTKQQLEKVKADPKTKERAAKADVYIARQGTLIADTSTTKANVPVNAQPSSKKKKKKS